MKKVFVHPNNLPLIESAFDKANPSRSSAFTPLSMMVGLPVEVTGAVPERDIEEVWHPPEAERFVSYGPEDECWARPLGLGSIERIDKGPAFWIVDTPDFLSLQMPIYSTEFKPRSFLRYSF